MSRMRFLCRSKNCYGIVLFQGSISQIVKLPYLIGLRTATLESCMPFCHLLRVGQAMMHEYVVLNDIHHMDDATIPIVPV